MMASIEIPWERYGTIAYIAEAVGSLGKTALQKLVYFLQEWRRVPLGYSFDLYTYGPFSADLMGDLDYTAFLGAVNVQYIINGGYSISSAEKNQEVRDRASAFLTTYEADFAEVVRLFGKCAAWQLELRATIHLACQQMLSTMEPLSDEGIVDVIHSLKPGKFTDQQIKQAVDELREHHVIAN